MLQCPASAAKATSRSHWIADVGTKRVYHASLDGLLLSEPFCAPVGVASGIAVDFAFENSRWTVDDPRRHWLRRGAVVPGGCGKNSELALIVPLPPHLCRRRTVQPSASSKVSVAPLESVAITSSRSSVPAHWRQS